MNTVPEAVIFRPTEEEFKNPIEYIESISSVGKKYGICKIIPPASWKSDFYFDPTRVFPTRVQRVDQLQVRNGPNARFFHMVASFLKQYGIELDEPPRIDATPIDLFQLFVAVDARGGFDQVTGSNEWDSICEELRMPTYLHRKSQQLRSIYQDYLLDLENYVSGRPLRKRVKKNVQPVVPPVVEVTTSNLAAMLTSHGSELSKQTLDSNNKKLFIDMTKEERRWHMLRGVSVTSTSLLPLPELVPLCALTDEQRAIHGGSRLEGRRTLASSFVLESQARPELPPTQGSLVRKGDSRSPSATPSLAERVEAVLRESKQMVETKDFGFGSGADYTFVSFKRKADRFKESFFASCNGEPSIEEIERSYWDIVNKADRRVEVEYGNDLDVETFGSGFVSSYEKWNLNILPTLPGSLLGKIDSAITGINVPWLYMGELFSSFCWHVEDNYLYSINYNHVGAVKRWYGVPGAAATAFEAAMREELAELFHDSPDLLHQLVTTMNPMKLIEKGVPVFAASQEAGQFIITFPEAYHAGFNMGFNCAEAVNFALSDWISDGHRAIERYRKVSKDPVFSHERLLLSLIDENITCELAQRILPSFTRMFEDEEVIRRVAEARSDEGTLPLGWFGFYSKEFNRVYYGHAPTNRTQWHRPENVRTVKYLSTKKLTQARQGPSGTAASSGMRNAHARMRSFAPHEAGSVEEDQCSSCRGFVYLSSMVCECSPTTHLCLHCLGDGKGCGCDKWQQTLWYRHTIADLLAILRFVGEKSVVKGGRGQ